MRTHLEGLALGVALSLAACNGGPSGGTSGSGTSGSAGSTGGSTTSASSSSATSGSHGSGGSTGATGTTSTTGATATSGSGGSSGGSASGTTGSSGGGPTCPAGWTQCTPENVCDLGCSPDGGACVDQDAGNPTQTGATCDAGAVCEGQACLVGSGPQVPNQGGGVLATPNVVMMTYSVDPNQSALESWTTWFGESGYMAQALTQYGVGNATVQLVSLPDTVAQLPSQYNIQQYLANEMTSGKVPAYAANNIYMLMLPFAWSDTSSFCQQQGGYHSVFPDATGNPVVYGVVADCGSGGATDVLFDEISLSHEIAEASTDPLISGWAFQAGNDAWSYIGGEIGDMCEALSTFYMNDAGYGAQLLWSNQAAAASQPPCQPWPAGQLFVTVLGDSALVPAAPGTTVRIPVTGWASAPTPAWTLATSDAFYGVGFSSSPALSSTTIGAGQQVMAELTVPAAAAGQAAVGGQTGAAYVTTQYGPDAGSYGGWLLVGVVATCQATVDCADPTTVCQVGDAGAGSCVPNLCAADAGAFSRCPVLAAADGVCVPADFGNGPVEVCNQAGSIAVSDGGCQPGRLVGGSAADYCVPSALCVPGQSTAVCAALCTSPDGGLQGSCPAGQDCFSMQSQYYGTCLTDCSSGQTCPANQTCYPFGGGVSLCYPN